MLLPPRENRLRRDRPDTGQLLELRLIRMIEIKSACCRRARGCARPRLVSNLSGRLAPGTDHNLLPVAQQLGQVELTGICSTSQSTRGFDRILDPRVLWQPDQTWVPDGAETWQANAEKSLRQMRQRQYGQPAKNGS